jgi:hypothetical protein
VHDPQARVVAAARFTVISADDFFRFWVMWVDHASIAAPIRVELKGTAFLKASENLFIAPLSVKVVIPTGLKLMSIVSRPGPAEILPCVWLELDFFGCCIYRLIDEPLVVVGTVTFLEPKMSVFFASAALALQAPFTLIPFLLPTVSFLPIHFHLEAK